MTRIPSEDIKQGLFIRELKNRFLCEVKIGENIVTCYVPSSCHLSHFLDLSGKKVLLVPTKSKKSKTPFALLAVPYKRNYIILNSSMANSAVAACIKNRKFAYLGERNTILTEYTLDGYKGDLYICDSDTVIEIKSVISTEAHAIFPSVYSERMLEQLAKLKTFLLKNKKVCFFIVSLHPYVTEIIIDQTSTFYAELQQCLQLGLILRAYSTRWGAGGLKIEHEIPIANL